MPNVTRRFAPVALLWFGLICAAAPCAFADDLKNIRPLLVKYCEKCHGAGEEVRGEVNFTKMQSQANVEAGFETWASAIELVAEGIMPPEGQPQPTAAEKGALQRWYHERFVESVQAHPGVFRPRRLSAHEYRNTLRTLLGFDLEVAVVEAEQTVAEKSLVMKLLPTDPPGPSGFKNDTSGNPLSSVIWDQYSYLVDNGLEKLFSAKHKKALQQYCGPVNEEGLSHAQAEAMLRRWMLRAYRRPPSRQQIQAATEKLQGRSGAPLETALRSQLKQTLMSAGFLYRGLLMNPQKSGVQQVDDYELAERLSYFLWADMPDETLFRLAQEGKLNNPGEIRRQVRRMLSHKKARNLAEDLGVQWFSLNEIDKVSNNPPVADALKSQPIDFLDYLFRSNRPLLELLDTNVTFMNPHTAKYYAKDRGQMKRYQKQKGIEVERVPNQKITLKRTPERGGLLTMPGILAMNKGPVLRGVWMLERVLGESLPEPPADVGQVPKNRAGEKLSFRERFELHRSNKTCAVCHDKIDPLGFSLQAYDSGGGYRASGGAPPRKKKKRKQAAPEVVEQDLDTSGRLPSGETFEDFPGLKKILVGSQREQVIRAVVERMMAYALCRKLTVRDNPAVDAITVKMTSGESGYGDLIEEIAISFPFRNTDVKKN